MKGHTTINDGEPVEVNRFYEDIDQLTKSIEKMVDKNDETLEVLFLVEMIKYTLVFNKVKRSNYATGCDFQEKLIEERSDFVYITEENECFRKYLQIIYRKSYLQEQRDFLKQLSRCKSTRAQAKIQPFFRKYNLNMSFYNLKQRTILSKSITDRSVCLYIQNNHFCIFRKTAHSSFPDAIDELKTNFE